MGSQSQGVVEDGVAVPGIVFVLQGLRFAAWASYSSPRLVCGVGAGWDMLERRLLEMLGVGFEIFYDRLVD